MKLNIAKRPNHKTTRRPLTLEKMEDRTLLTACVLSDMFDPFAIGLDTAEHDRVDQDTVDPEIIDQGMPDQDTLEQQQEVIDEWINSEAWELVFEADIELAEDVLHVNGTRNRDLITIDEIVLLVPTDGFALVSEAHIRVTLESGGTILRQESFLASLVNNVVVNSYGGDDNVTNNTYVSSIIHGGAGDDTLIGGSSGDEINGNDGNDCIFGGDGDDKLSGQQDNDELYGDAGEDMLKGHEGDDYLWGGAESDILLGHDGNDFLNGESGDDIMDGGIGHDTMFGGSGVDEMHGGAGDDMLRGESGNDFIFGDSDNDILYGDSHNDTLWGGSDDDTMHGGSGADEMHGGAGADTLRGDSGNDTIFGDSDNDNLYGGADRDTLSGGSGDDGLFGGLGTNSLTGGTDDDRFLVRQYAVKIDGQIVSYARLDSIIDKNSNDAQVTFRPGRGWSFDDPGGHVIITDGFFSDTEIERIDESLADLHHRVGNTKLLKKVDGGEIVFERLQQTGGTVQLRTIHRSVQIRLLDPSFADDDSLAQDVFHEIGHNWDDENARWDDFKTISGWRSSEQTGYTRSTDGEWWYSSGSTFARDLGRTNPYEDFATYFARVMMDYSGRSYRGGGLGTNAQKETFMNDFFASL